MKNNFKKNHPFLLGTLLILSLFQIKTGQAENKKNSLPTESRVVVGIKSQPDAWPWMAAILYADRSGSAHQRQFCGGTLIAPPMGTDGEVISVGSVIFHPDYDNETGYADIALLHLATPTTIQPVALADAFNFQSETGNSALAMGWGVYLQERNLGVSQQ